MSEIKTKKALGQHWLHDEDVLSDIVELAEIVPEDHVVEIGPGLGTLTEYLLHTGAHIVAVEYDEELYQRLAKGKSHFFGKNAHQLDLIHQDILRFNFNDLPPDYKVVANIPYYLTSNLVRTLSENQNIPQKVVLLVQKEVAERLCSGPGQMSLLSVWAQMYFDCELGPVVPAKLFTPPPKVDSQIVIMNRLDSPQFGTTDKQLLERVIKAGFSNKRKTLHNSLSGGLQIDKDTSKQLLEDAGIKPQVRSQELTIQQWIALAKHYQTSLDAIT